MIARFDHRPVLMFLALATVVCVLMVALTLFVSAQAVPTSGPSVDPNAAPSHSADFSVIDPYRMKHTDGSAEKSTRPIVQAW